MAFLQISKIASMRPCRSFGGYLQKNPDFFCNEICFRSSNIWKRETGGDKVDRDNIAKLYEAHFMRVFSYCMTLSGDRMLSEEITQEAFFRAFMKREDYHGGSSEVTWLCTIARNIFIDKKRRSGRLESLDDMSEEIADDSAGPEQTVADRDQSYRIHKLLQELEEPYREVFELRVFGELGFKEIGQRLSKTESWARVTYHRAKLKLQERMADQ